MIFQSAIDSSCLIKLENLFSNATKYRKLTSLHDCESYVGDVKFTGLGKGGGGFIRTNF